MKTYPTWINSIVAAMAVVTVSYAAEPAKTPAAGDKAPLVEGKDQDGKAWKLADVVGKKVVLLYFYPKDDTAGCTKQACGLRDQMTELKESNVEVVGVSFDDEASHRKFREKNNLNFTLIADTDGKIADAYGVRRSPEAKVARRVSFLIARDGKIVHVTDTPAAATHLTEMKEAIDKTKKS